VHHASNFLHDKAFSKKYFAVCPTALPSEATGSIQSSLNEIPDQAFLPFSSNQTPQFNVCSLPADSIVNQTYAALPRSSLDVRECLLGDVTA
jgi:hypothetical protein